MCKPDNEVQIQLPALSEALHRIPLCLQGMCCAKAARSRCSLVLCKALLRVLAELLAAVAWTDTFSSSPGARSDCCAGSKAQGQSGWKRNSRG